MPVRAGGASEERQGTDMLERYLSRGSDGVEVRFTVGDEAHADLSRRALGESLPELLEELGLDEFPAIRVVLVPDRDEFDRLVRDLLQIEIEVPSHPARIAQPQRTDMVVLSPSAYEEHSAFTYVQEEFERLLIHEAVHMIEEYLSPNIEASPRWWGEGLAVYFSEQWRHEDAFRTPGLDGTVAGEIPSLAQVELEAKYAYDWGWAIVAFIETRYGRETIIRIVRECADGDVLALVDGDRDRLESMWHEWAQQELPAMMAC